jgi:hypothetical protein
MQTKCRPNLVYGDDIREAIGGGRARHVTSPGNVNERKKLEKIKKMRAVVR